MAEPAAAAKGNTDAAAPAAAAAAAPAAASPAAAAPAPGTTGAAESGTPAGEKKGAAAPVGPPEKYTLAIPDEAKTYIDDTDVKAFEKMARETGWTNDEAQAAVDEHVRMVAEAAAGFLATTKADPDYGGEHLAETQRLAKVGIDLLRPEGHARRASFTQFLNKVGASNHIEVVSFLADLGKRASEDSPGQTSSAQLRGQRTAEQVLYDNTPKT
jgi:hypothetical protein